MKFDATSVQAAGNQCGVNVEALYKKYSRKSVAGQSSASASDGNANMLSAIRTNRNTDKLDRMRICKRCHGYGLMKEYYNHQVKEVNCIECDGDGVIESEKAIESKEA